jgi:murein DD-endopeptidase MepM/ murein hydrolase activator NlpD
MRNLKSNLREWREFLSAWRRFVFIRMYRGFSKFEKLKGVVAHVLYRQRGRFARPFVHSAMGGLVAMGITLAPVLASSFPGVEKSLGEEVVFANQVLLIQSDDTSTQISDKVRDKIVEYEVKTGDTVSAVSEKFGISKDTIRWENNLASVNAIKPGQTLKILPVTGVKHKVTRGETIYSVAKKYSANPQAIVDFPFNSFADNETFALAVGQDLIVPDGEKPNEVLWSPSRYVAAVTPNAGAVSATGSFAWPIGGKITQRFAWYHRGVDVATALGTPILAADSGTVVTAGWPDNSGYGNRVVIDHGNGYRTLYAHMSKVNVVAGQTVKRGDVIGLEGSTGRSTGPHLHFEIRKNGVFVNPLEFLK